ncbi:GTP cyclohydrolase FolE2 [Marinomonas pollencensis]|uniref:GTP cyclohydrolase FolE2 n=1 Tax=Marinomonas pollencensis TaxID=491954 RepID=A0A3E0DRK5_9GAMM|nr:GTP cyclohydrolase FolE2 [Marinomonas pollencensis]REG84972.1 GTP cyclohydrolase I [Marinomonas pollencensis]
MNTVLPDVSISDFSANERPLEWVGMQEIDLPVTITEAHYERQLHAKADVQVNLPAAHIKGIHMSRLYRLLGDLTEGESLSPARIEALLKDMIETHQDCQTDSARLRLTFDLLVKRPALITESIAGWKSYPVHIDAKLINGNCLIQASVGVEYSSTCPCSAALSRQLVEQGFLADFPEDAPLSREEIAQWLTKNATLATPHSQRSEAEVRVDLVNHSADFGLLELINQIEKALQTPLQTAVKRADEQAFASLNGQNLMFVEDAVRRIQAQLQEVFIKPKAHVRHLESLHPHDAVAWSNPSSISVS